MSYLLDTNVVSQLTEPAPSADVLRWLVSIRERDLFISAVTVRELAYGVAKTKRENDAALQVFSDRIETLIASYEDRILPPTRASPASGPPCWRSPTSTSKTRASAATAAVHGLVVTRNVAHLRGRGVPVLDPFRSPPAIVLPAI